MTWISEDRKWRLTTEASQSVMIMVCTRGSTAVVRISVAGGPMPGAGGTGVPHVMAAGGHLRLITRTLISQWTSLTCGMWLKCQEERWCHHNTIFSSFPSDMIWTRCTRQQESALLCIQVILLKLGFDWNGYRSRSLYSDIGGGKSDTENKWKHSELFYFQSETLPIDYMNVCQLFP